MAKFPNNPRFLKAKLVSYETFHGIAHSIQLVAFSKLKKLKKKIETRYVSLRLVKTLFLTIENTLDSSVKEKTLFVIFTSDKSCCGSINNPILNRSQKMIDTFKSTGTIVSIIPVAKKGFNILKKKYKREIKKKIYDLELDLNFFLSAFVLFQELETITYDEIYIIFPRFINNFLQQVVYYKFWSFEFFLNFIFSDRESNLILDIFLDQSVSDRSFLKDFHSFFLTLLLMDSFEETDYSQLGAKAKTMELAIQNVSDTINILRIKYNKARQSIITNEIIEILNASVAILE